MTYQINDILYTKDGRKSGNLILIDKYMYNTTLQVLVFMSDYGNKVKTTESALRRNRFIKTPGKAIESHKYYNYKQNHPEEFI